MQKFINLFIMRPVFASMIILAMVVVGAAAYSDLGVDRLPSVDQPTVTVRTTLPGGSPEDVESQVSKIIEEAVNTVAGIDELRSISGQGSSFVIATFRLDRNIDVAAQDVRDKVATVLKSLPDGTDPPVISKFDADSTPVLTYALSGSASLRELTEFADKVVKVQLERSKGVGEVNIVGGKARTINVILDADKLASYGLPVTAVRDAIARQNAQVPGGNLTGTDQEMSVRTMGRMADPSEFGDIVIQVINGAPVRVRDVAKVEDGVEEQRSVARLNGVPSVELDIVRQSEANTVEVISSVKENAERIAGSLPAGMHLEVIRDQSAYIDSALHEINSHLILGSILACLVVLAFTRSWRSTVIAGVAIPASVISTFGMMWLLGFTLNSVTMLALVLMVGIVIDDAIVVLENIFRFVEEKKLTPMEAARQGTAEIAMAVMATTLSLAVIFVPVSFMSSISGRFLYQFGITAAVAVMVSLVVSFVLTPTLSARMLGADAAKALARGKKGGSRSGFYGYIDRAYTWMLEKVMAHRFMTAILALLVMASSVPLFSHSQLSYMPEGQDEAEFRVSIELPQGASFAAADATLQSIEKDLMAMPQVRTILANAGGGFLGGVANGDIYVRIAPHEGRYFSVSRLISSTLHGHPLDAFKGNYTQAEVMGQIRQVMRKYKDIKVYVRNYPSFNIGGGNFDFDLSISGPELTRLAEYQAKLAQLVDKNVPGIIGVQLTLKLDTPELRVLPDRERASQLHIGADELATAVRIMVGGDTKVTKYHDNSTNEDYDVRLRLAPQFRARPDQVPNLLLASASGKLIELRSIASVAPSLTSSRIERLDRLRDSRLRGTLAPGYALADTTDQLLKQVATLNLPPGYVVSVRGAGREFQSTYSQFIKAFAFSIILMYMILASQYEHLVHPVTILLSIPLAIPFALISLLLAGSSLNLYSALGMLVLFGVVKKNAILQIDHMNQLRKAGVPRYQAVIEGNRDRLRPILMTTLSLVAGMLPLAIGIGPGAEERKAVAVVVIGGQTLSLLLTLLVTPVVYTLLDDLSAWIIRRKKSHESVLVAEASPEETVSTH